MRKLLCTLLSEALQGIGSPVALEILLNPCYSVLDHLFSSFWLPVFASFFLPVITISTKVDKLSAGMYTCHTICRIWSTSQEVTP